MKRIFGISLFLFLISPYLVMFSCLYVQKLLIKNEVERRLEKGLDANELVCLKFSKEYAQNQLHWKHSREFQYKNQMYDIVKSDFTEDSIYYYCHHDTKETKINEKLKFLFAELWDNDAEDRQKHKKLATHFKKLYFYSELFQPFHIRNSYCLTGVFHSVINYQSFSIAPQGPPPRFV